MYTVQKGLLLLLTVLVVGMVIAAIVATGAAISP
jgi:hypothetical protein